MSRPPRPPRGLAALLDDRPWVDIPVVTGGSHWGEAAAHGYAGWGPALARGPSADCRRAEPDDLDVSALLCELRGEDSHSGAPSLASPSPTTTASSASASPAAHARVLSSVADWVAGFLREHGGVMKRANVGSAIADANNEAYRLIKVRPAAVCMPHVWREVKKVCVEVEYCIFLAWSFEI